MTLHSFHLARVPARVSVPALLRPPTPARVPGLVHAQPMVGMRLGAPVVSPDRMQVRQVAFFAQWTDEAALEGFLAGSRLGRALARGWHVRLEFLRQWGHLEAQAGLVPAEHRATPDEPVAAVTIARMRLLELPRFLRWGRPVEGQVRDHPGVTLAVAAIRPPHTISTFSVWRNQREMVQMVHGHSPGVASRRHVEAMGERERRDFHHEFTTLRFRALSEHGVWQGRTGLLPGL